jgi:4'-phosphopantetheinyl transferase
MRSHLQNSQLIPPLCIEVWFCQISNTSKADETAIESLLSTSEKTRLEATKNSNKKREFLISRSLMRHALSRQFGVPENEWDFIDKPNCPPLVNNLPKDIYISLSHSNGLICFAIYSSPVGIDIENVLTERDYKALGNIVMNNEELRILAHNKNEQANNFYRIWCAKEAYYKVLSRKTQLETSLKKISIPTLINGKKQWFLYEGKNQQFQLSLVVKNKPEKIKYNYYPTSSNDQVFTLALSEEFII